MSRTQPDGTRLLTTREAGERLSPPVSPSRIRQFVLAGRLPALKEGRDLWIAEADLELLAGRGKGRPSGDEWHGRRKRAHHAERTAEHHAKRAGISRPPGSSWLVPSAVGGTPGNSRPPRRH